MQPSELVLRGSGDKPTSPSLIVNPVDFIGEDHLRERQICAVIDGRATTDALNRQAATTVLRFLNQELNAHLRDEADDLFPRLARRCTQEDVIEGAIDRIRADQDEATRLLPRMRAVLAACLDSGADLPAEGRGFRDVIAEALAMGVPVLVGLNALNRPAFETFAEGLAIQLPPEPAALMAWVDEMIATADELV